MADEGQILVVKKLKVAELKKELSERGLSTKGNKGELQARLQGALGLGDTEAVHVEQDVEDDLEHDDSEGKEDIAEAESSPETSSPENGETKEIISPIKPASVAITPPETGEQRRLQRSKRFGQQPSENDRKQARAQRFGIESKESPMQLASPLAEAKGMDVEKLKKRAERFGAVSPVITKLEESDKLKKRRERFGLLTTSGIINSSSEAKKKRAERFGI